MTFQNGDKHPMKNPIIAKKVSDKLKGRPSWNKGLTKETNESVKRISLSKLGDKNPMKRSEVKNKFSESNKGRTSWNKGKPRFTAVWNKGMKGIHLNPKNEFKKGHIPAKHEILIGDKNPMFGKHHSDATKTKMKMSRLKQVFPTKDTKIEVLIQNELSRRSVNFLTHVPIVGQPDIFIEPNICIFVDGCYWHGCSLCGFDKTNIANKIAIRDKNVNDILTQNGMRIFRIWEHDILTDAIGCIDKIIEGK